MVVGRADVWIVCCRGCCASWARREEFGFDDEELLDGVGGGLLCIVLPTIPS